MSKVPMIFEIELTVEKTKDEIGIWKKSHGQSCNRSPISDFLIINSFCNDCTSKRMSDGVHIFMITCNKSLRQSFITTTSPSSNENPLSPPFSKGGVGGFETYFLCKMEKRCMSGLKLS